MEFEEMQRMYGGKFVAMLNEKKVIASGNTFNETVNKLRHMNLINRAGLTIRYIQPPKHNILKQ